MSTDEYRRINTKRSGDTRTKTAFSWAKNTNAGAKNINTGAKNSGAKNTNSGTNIANTATSINGSLTREKCISNSAREDSPSWQCANGIPAEISGENVNGAQYKKARVWNRKENRATKRVITCPVTERPPRHSAVTAWSCRHAGITGATRRRCISDEHHCQRRVIVQIYQITNSTRAVWPRASSQTSYATISVFGAAEVTLSESFSAVTI